MLPTPFQIEEEYITYRDNVLTHFKDFNPFSDTEFYDYFISLKKDTSFEKVYSLFSQIIKSSKYKTNTSLWHMLYNAYNAEELKFKLLDNINSILFNSQTQPEFPEYGYCLVNVQTGLSEPIATDDTTVFIPYFTDQDLAINYCFSFGVINCQIYMPIAVTLDQALDCARSLDSKKFTTRGLVLADTIDFISNLFNGTSKKYEI